MVVPSLPALLPDAPWQVVSDLGPLRRPVDVDQMKKQSIFDISPRTLDKRRIEHLLPAVQALDVRTALKALGDLLPIFTGVLSDGLSQKLVLLGRPVALCLMLARIKHIYALFLVLGWATLVQMRVQHLVPDQILLCLIVLHANDRASKARAGNRRFLGWECVFLEVLT